MKLELLRQEPYLRSKISQRAVDARELIVSARTRNVVRDNILLMKHPHETKLAERAAQEQVAGRRRCDSRHASGVKET